MTISWDANQLPALVAWIETKLPLNQGEIVVMSMDIPPNCFAGQVDLSEKEFTIFSNIDSPVSDVTMNVFLGYVVALAYDKINWESSMPSHEVLFDCLALVCKTMAEFNEDFSKSLEEHSDILEAWHETHAPAGTTTSDPERLIGSMGASLFSTNPADTKDYGSN